MSSVLSISTTRTRLFVGALATFLAWRLPDVVDLLLIGFTINSAALFIPSIAMIYFAKSNSNAAFWSISLSLITVIGWYVAASLELHNVFTLDPVWPGLLVSATLFFALNRHDESQPA